MRSKLFMGLFIALQLLGSPQGVPVAHAQNVPTAQEQNAIRQVLHDFSKARFRFTKVRHNVVWVQGSGNPWTVGQKYSAGTLAVTETVFWPDNGVAITSDMLINNETIDWRFGNPQRAERTFRKSIAAANKLGLKSEHAIAQYWFGIFAHSPAGVPFVPEGPTPHLIAALNTFEQLKAAGLVARIHTALETF